MAPGVHGVAPQGLVAVHRQDHDREVRELGVDPPGRLDPVEDRHRDVHHDDVGLELAGQAHGLAAVAGLGDHRHAGVLERPADRLAQELVIVGEEDPHQVQPFVVRALRCSGGSPLRCLLGR